jgi:hypothetical protein
MTVTMNRIIYSELNARQKENYNYHKVSSLLADFGFTTIRLSDDWQGADFIAQHIGGEMFVKVQLKGRLTFNKKYLGKQLYIAFNGGSDWYLYPHDELLQKVLQVKSIGQTNSWQKGMYTFPTLGTELRQLLTPYLIGGCDDLTRR